MYRYFIQPQLNRINNTLIGYELLMKTYTDQGWRPPVSFSAIPAHTVADVLVATTSKLALKIPSVSVNLNRTQLLDAEVNSALIKAQNFLRPVKLVVELTEEPSDKNITTALLLPQIKRYLARGMELSLDDVDSGDNDFSHVKDLLPYASEIKFALQNFEESLEDPAVHQRVEFWQNLAHQRNLRFVLEGIEDVHDDVVADELHIDLRQGYFYGKPHLLRLASDDPA
ncbi:EAL domain-containing protein [Lacticaseibacillus porcinae]|uniref:EAL domain-containing protein n=1 Tax=Lacticaseibacillus porcinae TaxID=1123687 RepID=UPI000F799ABA|nr:EAL domain-containing protein [Lacticaseibacillus porcinae]